MSDLSIVLLRINSSTRALLLPMQLGALLMCDHTIRFCLKLILLDASFTCFKVSGLAGSQCA